MAKARLVNKKALLSIDDIISYQIINYCFFNSISLSDNELKCIVDLSKNGEVDLSNYCMEASESNFFKSPQSVRNFLCKAVQYGLVEKTGTTKKKVKISDKLELISSGNIILNYQIIHASKEN